MLHASEQTRLETGGILMGTWRRRDRLLVIGLAAGPGPDARRTLTSFERDIPANRGVFRSMSTLYPQGFVGLWHCHPGNPGYSALDLAAWRSLVNEPLANVGRSWNLAAAVCPILGRNSAGQVDALRVYYIERRWARPREIPWRIASPDDPVLGLAYQGQEGPVAFIPQDRSRDTATLPRLRRASARRPSRRGPA